MTDLRGQRRSRLPYRNDCPVGCHYLVTDDCVHRSGEYRLACDLGEQGFRARRSWMGRRKAGRRVLFWCRSLIISHPLSTISEALELLRARGVEATRQGTGEERRRKGPARGRAKMYVSLGTTRGTGGPPPKLFAATGGMGLT